MIAVLLVVVGVASLLLGGGKGAVHSEAGRSVGWVALGLSMSIGVRESLGLEDLEVVGHGQRVALVMVTAWLVWGGIGPQGTNKFILTSREAKGNQLE